MVTLVASSRRLFAARIVRYGLVGGVGIPVNMLALAFFLNLLGFPLPVASACAFEISTTVNFVLNQLYTYSDQRHLQGWEWPKRALKAQAASLSVITVAYAIGLVLTYRFHVSPFVANPVGIVLSFFLNFSVANRFVFRPGPTSHTEVSSE